MYKPKFSITTEMTKALMEVEDCRQAIIQLPLSVPMLESLRRTAKLLSTHFSTQIEGNKLSPSQVEEVLDDGNGRTARLLTNCILHQGGYGLHGIYSLEEYYAQHLQGYYDALQVSPNHNYYDGRIDADITPFIRYFTLGMADSFAKIRSQAEEAQSKGTPDQTALLRELTSEQQKALSLFARMKRVTSRDIAKFLKINTRSASALCLKWVEEGLLMIVDPSKKARRYQLTEKYEKLIAAQQKR